MLLPLQPGRFGRAYSSYCCRVAPLYFSARIVVQDGAAFDSSKGYIVGASTCCCFGVPPPPPCLQYRHQPHTCNMAPSPTCGCGPPPPPPPTHTPHTHTPPPPPTHTPPPPSLGLEPHSALPTALPACFGIPGTVLPEGLRGRTYGLASSVVRVWVM
jgi:hypothetical protein